MKRVLFIILAVIIMTTNVLALNERDTLTIVNETYALSSSEGPTDTIDISEYVKSNKNAQHLQPVAANAFIEMVGDMKSAGLDIMAISSYRTYDYQQSLFDDQVEEYAHLGSEAAYDKAKTIVAVPGTSEHQTGFAIDVSLEDELDQAFAKTPEGMWIAENAHNYGFVIRYPEDKQDITKMAYEPWHIRYVGEIHAEIMYFNNLCLEEYIDILKSNDSIEYTKGDVKCIIKYQTEYEDGDDVISISDTNTGGYVVVKDADAPQKEPGHWAEKAMKAAIDAKLLDENALLTPAQPISRENFVKLFSQYLNGNKVREYEGFTDVNKKSENYKFIVKAYETGIINGFGETFEPNGYITRQQAAVMLSKLLELEEIKLIEFTDLSDIAGWAFQDVQKVCKFGIINGYEDGSFKPKGNISVAEAASILQKISNKQ